MKTVILVRHAKSDWNDPYVQDHDRALNNRGERDAPFMAEKFKEKNIAVDLIISSTAYRAISTAKAFASSIEYDFDKIRQELGIYEVGQRYVIQELTKLDDNINTVMLFGHNPDFSSLAKYLCGDFQYQMTTCSIVCIDFEFENWSNIKNVSGKVRFFEYPKMYFRDADD